MIESLIEALTEEERTELQRRISARPSQLSSFIQALIDEPTISQETLQKRFDLSANTVFKNLSLARTEIYDVIKQQLKNPYDDILLPNLLYRRGLEVDASKLRIKLEQEFEQQGWWNVLQEFYNMEMIVAYARCDVEWLEKLKNKATANIARLHEFVLVDREIIVIMARLENGEVTERQLPALIKQLNAMLSKAQKLDHPIPLFNILHSLFVIYTAYHISVGKAEQTIEHIHKKIEHFGDRMIPYARDVAWLNTMGFYADFCTTKDAEPLMRELDKQVRRHGPLYNSQLLLSFCSYYFMNNNRTAFEKHALEFNQLNQDKAFAYKGSYVNCLGAYLRRDYKEFAKHKNHFYEQEYSRAYNEYDVVLRVLEILCLIQQKDLRLAEDKLEACIKFCRRHFTKSRIALEQYHWKLLRKAIEGGRAVRHETPVLRMSEFLERELQS